MNYTSYTTHKNVTKNGKMSKKVHSYLDIVGLSKGLEVGAREPAH